MGETIAVLFIFFILVVIGFIFYGKIVRNNLESEKDEVAQLRSVGIVERVMFLPEVQCSEDNVIKDNCADILKLDAAKQAINANEVYYYDLLEYGNITISQIYPTEQSWVIYSRKLDGYKNKFVTNVPISLYDPSTRKNGFGIISIESLSK